MAAAALTSRAAALQARPALAPRRAARRAAVAPRAAREPERPSGGISQQLDSVLQRYDFASAGLGALAVTGFCVTRGQDPATALWITAASTIVALVRESSGPWGGSLPAPASSWFSILLTNPPFAAPPCLCPSLQLVNDACSGNDA